jgi:hypothetical protein
MTFDQIVAKAELAGLTITGNRHGWFVHGNRDRFGREFTSDLVNTASLFAWARERFGD